MTDIKELRIKWRAELTEPYTHRLDLAQVLLGRELLALLDALDAAERDASKAHVAAIVTGLTNRLDKAIRERDEALARVAHLESEKRPFNDEFAQKVIDGQVKRLNEAEDRLSVAIREREALRQERDEARDRLTDLEDRYRQVVAQVRALELRNLRG